MEALLFLESLMQAAMVVAALVVALWSVRKTRVASAAPATGEIVWTLVAIAMLVGVSSAVSLGNGRGL